MKTDNYGDLFLARHKFRLLIRGWRCVPCSGRLSPCFHLERRSLCRSNESDVTYCLLTFPALPLRTYNFPPLPLSSSLHPVSSAKVTIASRMILSYIPHDILFNSVSFCIFCLIMLSRILQSQLHTAVDVINCAIRIGRASDIPTVILWEHYDYHWWR